MNEETKLREEFENLFREYRHKFKSGLPMHMVRYDYEGWCKAIRKCLEENKPFELPESIKELMKNPDILF